MKKGTRRDFRNFGIGGGILLGAVGGYLLYRGLGVPAGVLLGVAALLLGSGILAPFVLKPLYATWMGFAFCLGYVNSRILLGLFYVLVVSPVAILRRLLGRDSLDIRRRRSAGETYWRMRHQRPGGKESYERQF